MVLDDPAGIEAVLLGIADLGDHIVVKLRDLVVAALLDFELKEQTKFHARLRGPAGACISTGRAKSVNRQISEFVSMAGPRRPGLLPVSRFINAPRRRLRGRRLGALLCVPAKSTGSAG